MENTISTVTFYKICYISKWWHPFSYGRTIVFAAATLSGIERCIIHIPILALYTVFTLVWTAPMRPAISFWRGHNCCVLCILLIFFVLEMPAWLSILEIFWGVRSQRHYLPVLVLALVLVAVKEVQLGWLVARLHER